MKKLLYQTIKVTSATLIAILFAEIIGLHYSTTAGIIALLSVLDTRKQSLIVGGKRLGAATLAIVFGVLLFNSLGHHLWVLGLFLLVYIPFLSLIRSTEALAISTVLVTHIYAINTTQPFVFFNELGLLVIGVVIAWLLNIHMINLESEIHTLQEDTEASIKGVLHKMKLQLINQCSIEEQKGSLSQLDTLIANGLAKSIEYNNNYVFKDYRYYEAYFSMRRQQFFVLEHMEQHFSHMYMAAEEAILLSRFTELLAEAFNECNDGMALLKELGQLRTHYRESDLPKTRDEFENRATLYQYLNDLDYFIRIKAAFMVEHGEIHYC